MGSLCDAAENKVLEFLTGKTTWSLPSPVVIALSTTDFTDTCGSGTEPTTPNNYLRANTTGTWGTASGGSITNSGGAITFQQASGSWGTIGYFAGTDQVTPGSGNWLFYGTLGTSKSVASGDTVQFASSALTITAD